MNVNRNKGSTNIDPRELSKVKVDQWFKSSCSIRFDKKVSLAELFKDYQMYCEYYLVQGISKKMFSILLKECLLDEILNGSIGLSSLGKIVFKGVCILPNLKHHSSNLGE